MRILLSVTLCATLVSPALAQKMGSVNEDAPKVSQSIQFAGASSIKISYFAIRQGEFLTHMLGDQGERYREFFNRQAKSSPLGSLSASKAIQIGGKMVAAGDYKLSFTIDADKKFTMNLTSEGGEKILLPMKTNAVKSKLPRMTMALVPTTKAGQAELNITYGQLTANFAVGGKVAKKGATSRRSGAPRRRRK